MGEGREGVAFQFTHNLYAGYAKLTRLGYNQENSRKGKAYALRCW